MTSEAFRDRPTNPKELAIWWTEYVIRHQGAPMLHCHGADLSWIEYLMIDVIGLICLILFVIIWSVKKLFTSLFCSRKDKKVKSKDD